MARTIKAEFCGQPVTWTIKSCSRATVIRAGVEFVPRHYDVKWHRASMEPRLMEDDVFIGVNRNVGYLSVDGFCVAFRLTKDFVRTALVDGDAHLVELD